MSKMRSKRNKRRKRLCDGMASMKEAERTIRKIVETEGLRLAVSIAQQGKTQFPHWRFLGPDGLALLHYWPTNGTFWVPQGNERGKAEDPVTAMGLALVLAGVEGR